MRPGPIVRAVGEKGKPAGPVCWIVPRCFRMQVPHGYALAAPLKAFGLSGGLSSTVITRDLWAPGVAPSIAAVLIISAVLLRVMSEGGPSFPDSQELSPRAWGFWRVDGRTTLTATVMQRWSGEVLVVPLKLTEPVPDKRPAQVLAADRNQPAGT